MAREMFSEKEARASAVVGGTARVETAAIIMGMEWLGGEVWEVCRDEEGICM